MPFATLNKIPLAELQAMADGTIPDTITDMDFLETLAAKHCLLTPPWIIHTAATGTLSKVTRLLYTIDGELDKARLLLAVARKLRLARTSRRFGPRFSI